MFFNVQFFSWVSEQKLRMNLPRSCMLGNPRQDGERYQPQTPLELRISQDCPASACIIEKHEVREFFWSRYDHRNGLEARIGTLGLPALHRI